jgi:hypothetical protein
MNDRFDRIETRIDNTDKKLALVAEGVARIEGHLLGTGEGDAAVVRVSLPGWAKKAVIALATLASLAGGAAGGSWLHSCQSVAESVETTENSNP